MDESVVFLSLVINGQRWWSFTPSDANHDLNIIGFFERYSYIWNAKIYTYAKTDAFFLSARWCHVAFYAAAGLMSRTSVLVLQTQLRADKIFSLITLLNYLRSADV